MIGSGGRERLSAGSTQRHRRGRRCGSISGRSFNGHTFREILRLIDIAVPLDADMVREELERNDIDKGREQRVRWRDLDDVIGLALQGLRRIGHCYYPSAPRL